MCCQLKTMSKSCLQKLWKENTWSVTRLVSESFVIGEPAYYIVDCRIHVLSNAVDCDSKLILYCRLVAEQIFCITEHWVPTSNTYRSTTYREFCITKGKWTFNSLSAGCRFHKKKVSPENMVGSLLVISLHLGHY